MLQRKRKTAFAITFMEDKMDDDADADTCQSFAWLLVS